MFQSVGKIRYDPKARIKFEPWWCILQTDREIVRYYQTQIKQRYDLHFDNTVWGSHISIVRGTKPKDITAWKKHQGKTVSFEYDNMVYRRGLFLCINAYCPELNSLRTELGLSEINFHITVGRINKPYLQLKTEKLHKLFAGMGVPHIAQNQNLLPLVSL